MIFIVVVGIGVVIYYMFFKGKSPNGSLAFLVKESAIDQLKTRFVNGEIDEKTYLQMKETIKG